MLEDAIRRLKVLIFSRALVVSLLLGSLYFFRIGDLHFPYFRVFSYLIAFLYFLTIIYSFSLRWIKDLRSYTVFAYIQITVDVLSEIILVSLTGGIGSWFTFTFLLSIISASIVLNRRASYAMASMSSVLYGLLIEFQFYYQLPAGNSGMFSSQYYLYNVFTHIVAFYVVAFLSGYLSERLYTAIQTVKERDEFIDNLKALSDNIVESMPSGVFTTNLNWKIITFNKTAQLITGKSVSEVLDRKPQDIFPFLKQRDIPFRRLEGRIEKDGKSLFIGISMSPLKDSAGSPIGMLGIFQDLTKIKEMSEEIKKKENWAFIGELSASIAHELRNPLASLKASVEMLREKKVSEQYADQLMDIAITEMDRLNNIITDFLIYAKPQRPQKGAVDLHKSLRNLTALLRNSVAEREDLEIREDFSGELRISADARQLQQVLWNLGTNAVEAIPNGGMVAISTRERDGCVEILFSDSGSGISRADADRIFYPFFTTKEKGTGLGLAITKRIVDDHGGRITVESPPSGGTMFRVILPIDNIQDVPFRRENEKVKG